MKAGDSFRSGCFFRNENPDRVFGISSTEEMCTNFLMYYPRKTVRGLAFSCGIGAGEDGELGVCASSYERVESLDDIELSFRKYRLFGQSSSTCADSATTAVPLELQQQAVENLLDTATAHTLKDDAQKAENTTVISKDVIVDVEIPLQNKTPPVAVEEPVENVEIPYRNNNNNTSADVATPPHSPALPLARAKEVGQVENTTNTSTST
jgi:Copper type II ascorbate-dependent monooxygenase, C-terminal domain